MEITTIQKNIHTSPRKLRLVASLVRNMKPGKALQTLQFTQKAAALPLAKAIKTVLANAKQQNLETESLNFKKLEINEGIRMRRFRAQAKSRTNPYKKRTSQFKIVLSDDPEKIKNLKKEKIVVDNLTVLSK